MATTALFVELIVIGFGTAAWLGLAIAAILRRSISLTSVTGKDLAIPLLAIVYVLGIVTDRPVRQVFMGMENHARAAVFTPTRLLHIKTAAPYLDETNLPMEMEKFIRARSERLGAKIDYNRSRLRISRAWVLHFALLAATLLAWNARLRALPWRPTVALAAIAAALSLASLRTTYSLALDHQRDIVESFEIVANLDDRGESRREK